MNEKETTSESRDSETGYLLTYLQSHDALCPLCKYNLRNLTMPRCPECGREIKLTVGLTEPHLRWFVFLVVALSLAACAGILSSVILLDDVVRHRGLAVRDTFPVHFVLFGSVASIVPAALCISRFRQVLC